MMFGDYIPTKARPLVPSPGYPALRQLPSERLARRSGSGKFENPAWEKGWELWCTAYDRCDCENEDQRQGWDDAEKFVDAHSSKAPGIGKSEEVSL